MKTGQVFIHCPRNPHVHQSIEQACNKVCLGICFCFLQRHRAGLFNSFIFLTGCLIIHVLCFGLALPDMINGSGGHKKMYDTHSVYQEI